MKDGTSTDTGRKGSLANKFRLSLILVVLFSLITWSYFYMKQMTLAPTETSVVVGFWLLVIFGVRWVLGWIARHKVRTSRGKSS